MSRVFPWIGEILEIHSGGWFGAHGSDSEKHESGDHEYPHMRNITRWIKDPQGGDKNMPDL
jgi:hypothetical protein